MDQHDDFERLADRLIVDVREKLVASGIKLEPADVVRITFTVLDAMRAVLPEQQNVDEQVRAQMFAGLLPAVEKKLLT